jgi:hypothetical protein|tara:strand:- start:785 stop:1153 length:369 start_codon:yes stop_codon:yes gene_type:complete
MNKDLEKLLSYLLHSRNQVHAFHLQTKSFSEHTALGGYYDSIGGLFDGIVESYQGKYDIIANYENFGLESYKSGEATVAYLKALAKKVEDTFSKVEDTYIQNQLDGVTELIYSTIYKLRFLK